MKEIPMSNYGPCCCYAQKESRITNIPDKMQRPARREVDVNSIGKNMKYSDKNHILAGLGASVKILPDWALRGAVFREERPDETGDDTRAVLQLYYQAKQDLVSAP